MMISSFLGFFGLVYPTLGSEEARNSKMPTDVDK